MQLNVLDLSDSDEMLAYNFLSQLKLKPKDM